jgi:ferric hydroxamate transport system permease protein
MSLSNKWIKAVLTFGGGTALLFLLVLIHINQGNVQIPISTVFESIFSPQETLEHYTVRYLRLPRVVIGILAGGALAVSGAILQTITKNPLASASTLGIHSGTFFAVVAATVFFPQALGGNGLIVAFLGGILTAGLVYILSGGGKTTTPVKMVLAGMVVSIMFSSFTSVIQIFYEYETSGLFLWGAGSLVQNNWDGVQFAIPLIIISFLILLFMSKKLDVLQLGEEVSTSLGQNVNRVKLIAIINAVFLTAVTVSIVGPIGFVGLIAPHLVKLIGYRSHALLSPAAFIWGANVLVGADVLARIIDDSFSELPVGAITALIGAPWLIILILRKQANTASENGANISAGKASLPIPMKFLFPGLFILLIIAIVIGMSTGNYGVELGLSFSSLFGSSDDFMRDLILELRLPRILVAAVCGAALAISGLALQGILRNPLADPSVIGITSGAGVGALSALYVFSLPAMFIPIGAFLGAFLSFLAIMFLSLKSKFQPSIVALLGIGISAFGSAIIQILVVDAQLGVASALTWLSGTTYARGWEELYYLLIPIVIIVPVLYLHMKKLDVLSLGDDAASGLGLQVKSTRFVMAMLATLLAASAVATVGTIGFVGLIAPHLSRMLIGPNNKQLLPLTAITGAIFLTIADILSRTLLVPKEIPSGVLVALIGAPYFLWLMHRTSKVTK